MGRLFYVPCDLCPDRLADFAQPLGKQLFKIFKRLREAFDAFLQLVVGHAVFGVHLFKGGLVSRSQPANSVISPMLRKLAPITCVL